jgi:hypothetical protein
MLRLLGNLCANEDPVPFMMQSDFFYAMINSEIRFHYDKEKKKVCAILSHWLFLLLIN